MNKTYRIFEYNRHGEIVGVYDSQNEHDYNTTVKYADLLQCQPNNQNTYLVKEVN